MTAEATSALPPTALARLAESNRTDGSPSLFTSDLSVNEFVLIKECGFAPLGLVVGSSVYHIGIQVARWNQSQELTVLTTAMYEARELAMARMEAEAETLGADGVVGVRLNMRFYTGAADMAEFMAVGTAVRSIAHPGAYRTPAGKPFTSDLTGQDFFTLSRAGYLPLAFVLGTCVYHVAHQGAMQAMRQAGRNVELPNFTQAVYDARELAMARMQAEAERAQAEGIVGVNLVENTHVWGEHAVEFLAVGTAVRPLPTKVPMTAPSLVLGMQR